VIRVVVATFNPGKAREIAELLSGLSIEIVSLADYPSIPEPEEHGSSFAENAAIKARHACERTGEVALADDSGLEVDALGGRPGINSSRFAGPNAADAQRNALLLDMLSDTPDEQRTARFRCVAALATPAGEIQIFEGACEGYIVREPRGENGFGYDPIFYLPEFGKTMAELPPDVKNRISHRGQAISAATAALEKMVGNSSRLGTSSF